MASHYGNGIGRVIAGYGSYGYEPKLKQVGPLANPVGILPGSIATNIRNHQASWRKDSSKADNNIDFTMGMNGSILESAISEQLFCNDKVNPNNEPCYGISTVSGLQMAAAQGQRIYQIDRNNKAQLANIQMSGEEMANDINRAINSGGYVIVPERAVEGTGRNAIYVYMTYNGQDGHQAWKISGGLNGGIFHGFISGFLVGMISTIAASALLGAITLAPLLVTLLVIFSVLANFALFLLTQQYNDAGNSCFGLGAIIGSIFGGLSAGLHIADNITRLLIQAIFASGKGGYLDYKYGTGNNNVSC